MSIFKIASGFVATSGCFALYYYDYYRLSSKTYSKLNDFLIKNFVFYFKK